MTRTLFTSDWHFGHVNIMKYCPQRADYLNLPDDASTDLMNERLVTLWNGQVGQDDVVWMIGDMCLGKVNETLAYVGRLNGTIHLVLGNHDRPHPVATSNPEKRAEWTRKYYDAGFATIRMYAVLDFDGVEADVNHFPFVGNDHTDAERYNIDKIEKYSPVDTGRPLVHGHVHDLYATNGSQFNVGIDAWGGRMIPADVIGSYFRNAGFSH